MHVCTYHGRFNELPWLSFNKICNRSNTSLRAAGNICDLSWWSLRLTQILTCSAAPHYSRRCHYLWRKLASYKCFSQTSHHDDWLLLLWISFRESDLQRKWDEGLLVVARRQRVKGEQGLKRQCQRSGSRGQGKRRNGLDLSLETWLHLIHNCMWFVKTAGWNWRRGDFS